MIRILAVVLAALTLLLGVHMVFGAVAVCAVVAACAVELRGMQYGWRTVPRAVR